jgi:hypothetical protein
LLLETVLSWAGVVDELEFAKVLVTWCKHGFPELGDSVGRGVRGTLAKVNINKHKGTPNKMLIDSHRKWKINLGNLNAICSSVILLVYCKISLYNDIFLGANLLTFNLLPGLTDHIQLPY